MSSPGPQVARNSALRRLPQPVKRGLNALYWKAYDFVDFFAEVSGHIPSHSLRLFIYRQILNMTIGKKTSIHRSCRFYRPSRVSIGANTIINRDILLDGRMGLHIGSNVSISEGAVVFTLEHDPDSPDFASRGAAVQIEDYVFIGAHAMILPGITISRGAVVAAGAVVTKNVGAYMIVGGVPARPIGERTHHLRYQLNYQKFLG